MDVNAPNKYFAFISYNHEDEGMAIWFQHEMENYHLPVTLNGRPDLPTEFRPVFRDYDELKAGNLPKQIYEALASTTYLVVICSPHSAQSEWVNKEITDFIAIGKGKGIDNSQKIFPFIVEGEPHAEKESDECYPPSLLDIAKKHDILGGDANKEGNDHAFVKVLAGMLPNVAFDELWNRYEKDKAEEQRIERERRDNLLRAQSRFVAEKAMEIAEDDSYLARLLAVEVLPEKLDNPNRPYTVEAEIALRRSSYFESAFFQGHTSEVITIVFSHDGKLIASIGDNTIRVWEANTGKELLALPERDSISQITSVNPISFSFDNSKIVCISNDTIHIWDIRTGKELYVYELQKFSQEPFYKKSVAFSPDGKHIAYAHFDKIHILDINTGTIVGKLIGHTHIVTSVSFSHDATRLITASFDRTIRIWDIKTGKVLKVLKGIIKGHRDVINFAVFSPNDLLIVSASSDKTIRIWDAQKGNQLKVLRGHRSSINTAVFSCDSKRIVSASLDRTVCVWNAETGKIIKRLDGSNAYRMINYADFCPQNLRLVSLPWDKTIRIWDTDAGVKSRVLKGHDVQVTSAVFSPDGMRILSASWWDKSVRVWDVKTGGTLKYFHNISDRIKSIDFSDDGNYAIIVSTDNHMRLLDVETGNIVRDKSDVYLSKDVLSPDKKHVISTNNKAIFIKDVNTGNFLKVLEGHDYSVKSAVFSPDGTRIVSASYDKTIRVWDVDSGKQIGILTGHTDTVNDAHFSPDGRHIVSASSDGTIRIWDFPPLQELIDQTRERFKNRPLTKEEKKQYYLE